MGLFVPISSEIGSIKYRHYCERHHRYYLSLSILLNLFRPSTRGLYITVNDLRNVYISKKSKTFNCCEFFYVICEYADIFLSVKFVHAIRYRFCLYILRKVCQNALYGDEYKVQTSCKKLSATAAYNCCFRLWL